MTFVRCDPDVVGSSKEVELILSRLSLFLQGKWCMSVTRDTGGEEWATAEEDMKDWFAAAEQVRRAKHRCCTRKQYAVAVVKVSSTCHFVSLSGGVRFAEATKKEATGLEPLASGVYKGTHRKKCRAVGRTRKTTRYSVYLISAVNGASHKP